MLLFSDLREYVGYDIYSDETIIRYAIRLNESQQFCITFFLRYKKARNPLTILRCRKKAIDILSAHMIKINKTREHLLNFEGKNHHPMPEKLSSVVNKYAELIGWHYGEKVK